MGPIIVSDASCLIGLSNIEKINILPRLFSRVLIPPAVEKEFGDRVEFAECVIPSDRDLVRSFGLFLGAGESEAIVLAIEHNALIILDDKKARIAAEGMGLHTIGTVGILLKAKQEGIIDELRSTLEVLETKGFYISALVKEQALKLAGE